MAIVLGPVFNDFSPVAFNGTLLPYGITMPMLHFTDGEEGGLDRPHLPVTDGPDVVPNIVLHDGGWCWCWDHTWTDKNKMIHMMKQEFSKSGHTKGSRQNNKQKNNKQKNNNKKYRSHGNLKQPGGSSCNQRR